MVTRHIYGYFSYKVTEMVVQTPNYDIVAKFFKVCIFFQGGLLHDMLSDINTMGN